MAHSQGCKGLSGMSPAEFEALLDKVAQQLGEEIRLDTQYHDPLASEAKA